MRYWREGIVLAERGEHDPHRDDCADCRREHAARHQLIRALPLAAAANDGDTEWQDRVWQQIARERGVRPARVRGAWRWSWSLSAGLGAGCAAVALWLGLHALPPPAVHDAAFARSPARDDGSRRVDIISGPVATRSTSARVGDRARISARLEDDVRVYRADQLVLRCTAALPSDGCIPSLHGLVAETGLITAGDYQLVIVKGMTIEPAGALGKDLGAVVAAGGDYDLRELSVR